MYRHTCVVSAVCTHICILAAGLRMASKLQATHCKRIFLQLSSVDTVDRMFILGCCDCWRDYCRGTLTGQIEAELHKAGVQG